MEKNEKQHEEDLLQQLTDDSEVVDNWYRAREYVGVYLKEKMCRVNAKGEFAEPLHVIVKGASPLMCAAIREIILRAHYYDFDEDAKEETCKKTSVITVSCDDEEKTRRTLLETPFLDNYLRYCWGVDGVEKLNYLDVRVDVETNVKCDKNAIVLTDEDLNAFFSERNISHTIDTRRAQYANQAYNMGQVIGNLPDINSTDVRMYEIPMTVFDAKSFCQDVAEKWGKITEINKKISNVFCTDAFDLRIEMLMRTAFEESAKGKDFLRLDKKELKLLTRKIEENILELSKCEHSRWMAEKLLLGFKPWTSENHYEYSRLFGKEKKAYRDSLKKKDIHYDICSYRDLCRRDPGNRKYDTFLVLSMLKIDENSDLFYPEKS